MFYLRKLSYLHVDNPIFYKCIVVSILFFNFVVWFWACRKDDFRKMESVVKRPSKITGNRRNLAEECKARILQNV